MEFFFQFPFVLHQSLYYTWLSQNMLGSAVFLSAKIAQNILETFHIHFKAQLEIDNSSQNLDMF